MYKARHATAMVVVSTLLLAGCDNASNSQTVGQKLDAAIARTEVIGNQTLAKTQDLAAATRSEVQSGEFQEKVRAAGSSISSTVDDLTTTAKIRTLMSGDSELKTADIDVETSGGNVVLRGTVPTVASKNRVELLAKSIAGVSKVKNELIANGS